ncbi:acetoin dehydrogenase dihydrolipoyllysine-residue acetyltransferase subunit [Seohaeicola nanhaiensis]|uniref:Acetoin dehydrogenase dihydrolipoyllysine-residue acetyltransferase subunit n=1 Tax=Seohaeicola nanhaiensis TaxID=1387282 RepID=A0ABV9KF93_9RHOB
MATEVILPKVDMDMETGLVSAWHVAEGEAVEKGAALFDIETDKAAMEVESPASGILRHVIAEVGDKIPVGDPVAWIYAEGEEVPEAPPVARKAEAEAPVAAEPEPVAETPEVEVVRESEDPARPRATPAARQAAREGGLALEMVPGTGPRGRIQRSDVEAALTQARPSEGMVRWTPGSGPLAVTRGRGSGVPLVLFHGFSADSKGWAPLERVLPGGREVIRVDLPSHGASPLRRVADFAGLVKMMVAAFDDLGLDKAHLVGHSLGGALAAAVADIRGRRIASLGLIAPAGLGPDIDGATLLGIARASRAESLGPWLRQLAGDADRISDGFVRAAMAGRSDPALRAAQGDLAQSLFPDSTQSFSILPALERIEAPMSVIWGRRDSILPVRHAQRLPGLAAQHLLADAGHIPHVEMPETVAKLLSRLFKAGENPTTE